jgi:hypothetical protein
MALAQALAVATFILGFLFGIWITKAAIAAQLEDDDKNG